MAYVINYWEPDGPNHFCIYVDKQGKMPQLRANKERVSFRRDCTTHPYFVRYENNKPVEVKPYPGQFQVWDYSTQRYILLTCFNGVIHG